MPTIDATVGGVASNSFELQSEADAYFDSRLPLTPPWLTSGANNAVALIMATRVLSSLAVPHRRLIRGDKSYYVTSRQWTGAPATATQALPWPRTGMFDRLGRAIPADVIPQELKDAESELAGQLLKSDTTLDNDVSVQGISSVRAGSVSVTFKDSMSATDTHFLPNAVWLLMPDSWFTDELIVLAGYGVAEFEVL